MRSIFRLASILAGLCLLSACTGGGGGGQPAFITIRINPPTITVLLGAPQTFTVTITGTNNRAVSWTVQEGPAGGTIDTQGNYTAPQVAGTYHVVVTSMADPSQSATATITVPQLTVTVSPNSVTVFLGALQAFTATISGSNNTAVTWAIQEGAAGGSIDAQGNYTAPKVVGIYHVIATSVADKSKSDTAVVTVPPLAVSILPTADTLGPSGLRNFGSSVTGAADTSVTWSITEGAAGGTVMNGAYTAPKTQGTFHVVATSVADPAESATATVTVVASGFLPTGNMRAARTGHTATLLNTGEALVAGGINHYFFQKSGPFNSCLAVDTSAADLFDPGTGMFASTSPMNALRAFHTATLLQSGKVLVAGGSKVAPPTAEIYDPATAVFTATGNMLSVRQKHTATLLTSGKVLLAGGLVGGATAELFDPAMGTFTATGSMADSRVSHTATLLANGRVLVAGGDGSSGTVATAEIYDPTGAGTFTATGSMTTPRTNHTATFIPSTGMVLIAGGSDQNGTPLASAELYNPATGLFTVTGSMTAAHSVATATMLPSGKVLIAGGGNFLAELFDPATGTFTSTGSMFTSRTLYAATALPNGDVLVTGTQIPVFKTPNSCIGGANSLAEIYH